MKAIDRQAQIIDLLEVQEYVQVAELAELFHVSMETIRRDLDALESQSLIIKVHGGAKKKSTPSIQDYFFQERMAQNLSEKKALAKAAAAFVTDGDTVALNTGSTVLQMVPHLVSKDLSIITASLPILTALSTFNIAHLKGKIIFLGGEFNENSLSVYGELSLILLDSLSISKLFFSPDSFHPEKGFSFKNMREGILTQKLIEKADETYLLVDSSKIGSQSFYHIPFSHKVHKILSTTPYSSDFSKLPSHIEWIYVAPQY